MPQKCFHQKLDETGKTDFNFNSAAALDLNEEYEWR